MKKKYVKGNLSKHWHPEPQHDGPPVTRYFLQPDEEIEPQGIVITKKDKIVYVKVVTPDERLITKVLKAADGSTVYSFRLGEKPEDTSKKKKKRNVVVAKPITKATTKKKVAKKAPAKRSKRKQVASKK